MNGEKFHLNLSGRPLDGYRTEEVAAALARLFRIPRKHARNLLRGSPSRIKRELDKEKAVHLMGKIIACGAQCELSPSKNQNDAGQLTEAGIDLPEKLELEIEQPESDLGFQPAEVETQPQTDAVSGDQMAPLHSGLQLGPAVSDGLPADRESGIKSVQSESTKTTVEEAGGTSGSIGGRAKRVMLSAAAAAVLLGFALWAGLNFLDGSAPMQQNDVAEEKPIREVVPKTVAETEDTRQRLELLASAVKIWMIQYGAGFDPSQVTMERMQQDLGISPEEMVDGWGTRFHYSSAAESYTLTSAGPDRTFDSEDDIKVEKPAR